MRPPEKTQEQRIKDAAEALRKEPGMGGDWERIARVALEAADAPPKPKWPSDVSVKIALANFMGEDDYEAMQCRLHAAMLADPIIKAAIAYRDAGRTNISGALYQAGLRIDEAVNEAGL